VSEPQTEIGNSLGPAEILALRPSRGQGLEPDVLRWAYAQAARNRALILRCVALTHAGEAKFWIGGAGEEVHGVGTALALWDAVPELDRRAIFPHYRSEVLAVPLGDLEGYPDMARDVLRQLLTRSTDPFSGGRQMLNHYFMPRLNIQPNQSPVGMQLGKAAGYAMGYKLRGIGNGLALSILGDGTTAEGDLHDAMNAASVWRLPLLILVTDNGVAISTSPEEGRGIRDFAPYAEAFGFAHFVCDGHDFHDTYRVTREACLHVREQQSPAILHARLPRLLGHSSAGDMHFRYDLPDPLLDLGLELAREGILGEEDVLRRTGKEPKALFQANHEVGRIFAHVDAEMERLAKEVCAEPIASPDSVVLQIHPPYPTISEEPAAEGRTNVPMNIAVRTALDRILAEGDSALWGQDVAALGGVMSCTRGLKERYPDRVFDAPLNEPLIVGTAVGAALHPDLRILPEIQFADYSFNAMHWFIHMANLHWSHLGQVSTNVTVRMPVDPFRGGSIYHSMSVDGYYAHIPGLVMLVPSTSFDAYGLLRAAARYEGPVLFLEPKILYRMNKGPKLPGEPEKINRVRLMSSGKVLDSIEDFQVPLGKAALRREGRHLTIVAWGWAVHQALQAAETLAGEGTEAEVLDLRSLLPYDREAVYRSVEKTGRLLVAHPDRVFAGFGRQVQGDAVERFPGLPACVVGMREVPGIPQCVELEDHVALQTEWIEERARDLLRLKPGTQEIDPDAYVRKDDPLAWLEATTRFTTA